MQTQQTQPIQPQRKKRRWKRYFFLVIFLMLLAGGGYGYYWYATLVKTQQRAEEVLSKFSELQQMQKEYTELTRVLKEEHARCSTFISTGQGAFGEFEYCKKFIEWVDKAVALEN